MRELLQALRQRLPVRTTAQLMELSSENPDAFFELVYALRLPLRSHLAAFVRTNLPSKSRRGSHG